MKLVSGIVDSGFFAQSALSAEVATKDSIGRNISETYLTGVDLTPYQTTAGMTAYQSAGDYYSASNPSGFLVADDITGKLDALVYATDSGSFLTAVPDTYLQNTDLSTTDGKVTAISGIPLSAGGDVPEGVMVESGLEYNAVNEISGYNGSAIAQYGAEKQFIVHDDTLVHLSNSAQYALGVNLSAVAQLLGVDETVLFSGNTLVNTTNTIALSEPLTAFKKFKIFDHPFTTDIMYVKETTFENVNPTASYLFGTIHAWVDNWQATSSGSKYDGECYYSANSNYDTILTMGSFINSMASSGAHTQRNQGRIYKVIGIGRKA